MTALVDTAPLRIAREAARQLTLQEKAQLISELAQAIARATPTAPATVHPSDGLARFRAFAAAFRADYPSADVTGRLEADRHEREAFLLGEAPDVHP